MQKKTRVLLSTIIVGLITLSQTISPDWIPVSQRETPFKKVVVGDGEAWALEAKHGRLFHTRSDKMDEMWVIGVDKKPRLWNGTEFEQKSNNNLNSLHSNRKGDLWGIGTDLKAYRWDGYDFTRKSLLEIDTLYLSPEGQVWGKGKENTGAPVKTFLWDERTQTFVKKSETPTDLFFAPDGSTWGLQADIPHSWDQKDQKFVKKSDTRFSALYLLSATQIWGLGKDENIYRWNGEAFEKKSDTAFTSLLFVSSEKLWAISKDFKAHLWDGEAFVKKSDLPVKQLYTNPQGDLAAIAREAKTLHVWDKQEQMFFEKSKQSLATIHLNAQREIWGTLAQPPSGAPGDAAMPGQLFLWDGNNFVTKSDSSYNQVIFRPSEKMIPLSWMRITGIAQLSNIFLGPNNRLWCEGTDGTMFTLETEPTKLKPLPQIPSGSFGNIKSISIIDENKIMGINKAGRIVQYKQGGVWETITPETQLFTHLSATKQNLWHGNPWWSLDDKGVLYRGIQKKPENFIKQSDLQFAKLQIDPRGNVWAFDLNYTNLYLWNKATNQFEQKHAMTELVGLHFDAQGNAWSHGRIDKCAYLWNANANAFEKKSSQEFPTFPSIWDAHHGKKTFPTEIWAVNRDGFPYQWDGASFVRKAEMIIDKYISIDSAGNAWGEKHRWNPATNTFESFQVAPPNGARYYGFGLQGDVWAIDADGTSVYKYDATKKEFVSVTSEIETALKYPTFYFTPENNIFITDRVDEGKSSPIYHWNYETSKFEKILSARSENPEILANSIADLSQQGQLWVVDMHGPYSLHRWNDTENVFTKQTDLQASQVKIGPQGEVWIIGPDANPYVWDLVQNSFVQKSPTPMKAISIGPFNNVWTLGQADNKAYFYQIATKEATITWEQVPNIAPLNQIVSTPNGELWCEAKDGTVNTFNKETNALLPVTDFPAGTLAADKVSSLSIFDKHAVLGINPTQRIVHFQPGVTAPVEEEPVEEEEAGTTSGPTEEEMFERFISKKTREITEKIKEEEAAFEAGEEAAGIDHATDAETPFPHRFKGTELVTIKSLKANAYFIAVRETATKWRLRAIYAPPENPDRPIDPAAIFGIAVDKNGRVGFKSYVADGKYLGAWTKKKIDFKKGHFRAREKWNIMGNSQNFMLDDKISIARCYLEENYYKETNFLTFYKESREGYSDNLAWLSQTNAEGSLDAAVEIRIVPKIELEEVELPSDGEIQAQDNQPLSDEDLDQLPVDEEIPVRIRSLSNNRYYIVEKEKKQWRLRAISDNKNNPRSRLLAKRYKDNRVSFRAPQAGKKYFRETKGRWAQFDREKAKGHEKWTIFGSPDEGIESRCHLRGGHKKGFFYRHGTPTKGVSADTGLTTKDGISRKTAIAIEIWE